VDQRQAFLDAIIADPDDDAVRLIYADWLEENGTAVERDRARFIHLQIELQGIEDNDRRRAIIDECNQLIDRHWQEWTYGFQADRTAAYYYKDTYERGFLPYMCLDDEDLEDPTLDTLLAHEPITHFFMRRIDTFPDAVAQWKHLPRVRQVSFSGGGDNVKALLRSPLLTGLRVFAEPSGLDDVALITSDPRFAGLRRLEIGYSDLGDSAVEMVSQSRTLSHLTAFDYSGNRTTIAALEAVAGSPLASRLTFIGLRQYDWGEAPTVGSRAAELLAGFRCLQGIDLHGQQIGDEGAEVLAGSPNLADLKLLQLGQNGLGLRGMTALLSSRYLTKVEELDLSNNRPGGDWITALASTGPRRLLKLTLEDNQLDGQAVVLLADAVALEGVRELSRRGNPIGDQSAAALAGSARLTQLRKLGLGSCDIGDEGANALAGSSTLDRLEGFTGLGLADNRYGQEAARRLRKRLDYDPSSY
jgi:uncharacterized protein (TIGR02996 family)